MNILMTIIYVHIESLLKSLSLIFCYLSLKNTNVSSFAISKVVQTYQPVLLIFIIKLFTSSVSRNEKNK